MHRTIGRPSVRTATVAIVALFGLVLLLEVLRASPSWAASGWFRVPHDEAVFGGSNEVAMFGVETSSSGFVAVGYDSALDGGAVWWSADGATWHRASNVQGSADAYMADVAEGPSTMVAVGYADNNFDLDAGVWTGDGDTWSRVPDDPSVLGGSGDQIMTAVAAGGPGLVAVGSADYGDAAVWTSVDGLTWTRVPHDEAVFGGADSQAMEDVAAGGPGVVAVGYDRDVDAAAVWASSDGIVWTRVPHVEAVFGGPASQSMGAVTVGGPGFVAVGSDSNGSGSDAAVWTSVDGL